MTVFLNMDDTDNDSAKITHYAQTYKFFMAIA